jgi:hypothetical protein
MEQEMRPWTVYYGGEPVDICTDLEVAQLLNELQNVVMDPKRGVVEILATR